MAEDFSDLIFILGAPRSGTSLMYGMLLKGQHNLGGVRLESFLYNRANTYPYHADSLSRWKYMQVLLEEAGLEVADTMSRHSDWFGVFKEAYAAFLKKNEFQYFVEKSPIHTAWYKEIARDFPGSKWVIIGRNPAANIHSLAYTRKVWFNLGVDRLPWKLGEKPFLRYLNATVRFFYYWRIMKVASGFPNCIAYVEYEAVITQPEAFRGKMETMLSTKLETLKPIVPSGSSSDAEQSQAFHTSQIDAYQQKMPKWAQGMVRAIFTPKSILDHIAGFGLRISIMYPGFWVKRWLDYRRKERA